MPTFKADFNVEEDLNKSVVKFLLRFRLACVQLQHFPPKNTIRHAWFDSLLEVWCPNKHVNLLSSTFWSFHIHHLNIEILWPLPITESHAPSADPITTDAWFSSPLKQLTKSLNGDIYLNHI